jgi:multicomponent Na+:H+ antiporter subunit D
MVVLAFYNLSGAELNDLSLISFPDVGIDPFSFTAHPYARMAVFGFLFVGAIALLYGLQVAGPREQAVSLIAVASAVGIGFSANFITLFIFWEVLTFSVAFLIMLKQTSHAIGMGFRFMVFHVAGGLLLLLGIVQHYTATGSLVIATPEAGLIFFALGIGFKAAFLPFHVWVAWGYPTASFPTSVVLAGLTTKIGVYAVARILPPHEAIALMGASMAVFGICCALLQKDMRRLLSYHIISQVGYMVAGAGVAGYYGIDGSLLHVVNHMLYKALLFMSAGAVLLAAGTENLHDLGHHHGDEQAPPVWKGLPIAALGAVVGALAISGVPPFNGYVSKYLLKKAMYGAGPAELMLMFASVGTVVSFCKFCYFGFIKGRAHMKRDITVTMKAAILVTSASCIILGVYPYLMKNILPYQSKLAVYNMAGVTTGLKFLGIGIVVFVILKGILERGIKPPAWMSVEYLIYRMVLARLMLVFTFTGRMMETAAESSIVGSTGPLGYLTRSARLVERMALPWAGEAIINWARTTRDKTYNAVVKRVQRTQASIRKMELSAFTTMIKLDYNPRGEQFYRRLTLMNLDVCIFIVVVMLVIVLSLRLINAIGL